MKLLKFQVSEVFDSASLKNQPIWFDEVFLRKWEPFYNEIEKSIKAIPLDDIVLEDLKWWIDNLNSKIEDAQKKKKLSEIGRLFLRYRKILRTKLQEILVSLVATHIQPPAFRPAPKVENTSASDGIKRFTDYLQHEKNAQLAEALKNEFTTEKGKNIKLMLMDLGDRKLLKVGSRENQSLYDSMQAYFGRDIGKYQGIFDFKFAEAKHKADLESISQRIERILQSL